MKARHVLSEPAMSTKAQWDIKTKIAGPQSKANRIDCLNRLFTGFILQGISQITVRPETASDPRHGRDGRRFCQRGDR